MRNYNPVHGIDYLVDYYSILGVSREATPEQLKQARNDKMLSYHPDRLANAAPEFQRQAEFKSDLISRAYQTLSDAEKRSEFDQKLGEFEKRNPKLVSKDGSPIIALDLKMIDIDHLLSGSEWGEKDAAANQLKAMSGYDDMTFKIIEQQYRATENPGADLKAAYRAQLLKKNVYLSLMESVEWEAAGVLNQEDPKMLQFPEHHTETRKRQVEEARQRIDTCVDDRVKALASGYSGALMLPDGKNYNDSDVKADALKVKKDLGERAKRSFERHLPEIEKLAEEKSKVLESVLELTEWEYLTPQDALRDKLLLLAADKDGKIAVGFVYAKTESGVSIEECHRGFSGAKVSDMKANKEALQGLMDGGMSVAALYKNPDVDFLMEMIYVMNEHYGKRG